MAPAAAAATAWGKASSCCASTASVAAAPAPSCSWLAVALSWPLKHAVCMRMGPLRAPSCRGPEADAAAWVALVNGHAALLALLMLLHAWGTGKMALTLVGPTLDPLWLLLLPGPAAAGAAAQGAAHRSCMDAWGGALHPWFWLCVLSDDLLAASAAAMRLFRVDVWASRVRDAGNGEGKAVGTGRAFATSVLPR